MKAQPSAPRPSAKNVAFKLGLRLLAQVALPALFVVGVPLYVLNNLPAITAMLNMPTRSMGLEDKVDGTKARDFSVRFDRLGAEYGDSHVANAVAKPIAIADLASGVQVSEPNTPVTDVALFDANATCTLQRPARDEKVLNVYVRNSGIEAPVQAINSAEMQRFLEQQVSKALEEGKPLDLSNVNEGRFNMVDVYVTDTTAPIYLVLQTFSSNIVWNLHTAPGVTVSHVAMISGGSSGLAGDIGTATIESLRARDFGAYPEVSYNSKRPAPEDYDCMAWPYQQPNESWTAWQGSKDGNTMDGNLLFGQSYGYDVYEHWYRKALGTSPNENAVISALARAALAGPIPAQPVAFPKQDGLKLRLMRHDQVFSGTTSEREKKFVDHYQGILAAAAGGDITSITRPEVELALATNQPKPTEVKVEGDSGGTFLDLVTSGSPWEQEFQAMIDMSRSNKERRVGFDQEVSLEDMLAQDEAMPPKDQQLLYAMIRAPRAMEHHCQETLVEIAAKCRVLSLLTRQTKNGTYAVNVTFGYVPNYTIGTVKKNSGWAFVSAFLPDTTATSALDTPEQRKAFLGRLIKVCDELRAETGSCVISTVGFYMNSAARFSPSNITTWAAGWVSVYSPDNPFEKEQLEKKAQEIWARTQ